MYITTSHTFKHVNQKSWTHRNGQAPYSDRPKIKLDLRENLNDAMIDGKQRKLSRLFCLLLLKRPFYLELTNISSLEEDSMGEARQVNFGHSH